MAIWPFNRREETTPSNVPVEVQQYYAAERRDRAGLAWLLAAGTLLATVVVVLGLFFGGRWLYRKVRHQETAKTTTPTAQTTQNPNPTTPAPEATPPTPTPSNPPAPTPTPTPTPTGGMAPLPRTGPDEDL